MSGREWLDWALQDLEYKAPEQYHETIEQLVSNYTGYQAPEQVRAILWNSVKMRNGVQG